MITEETARKQLETLHREGGTLAKALEQEEGTDSFEECYQSWYSRALPLMKALGLDRYAEFQSYYMADPRYGWYNTTAYVIQDYFRGRESADADFDSRQQASRGFKSQLAILKSVSDRLSWSSIDTEDQAERGLFLALLDTARGLIKPSERAAGALAGTVLESHLKKLAAKHKVRLRKQTPSLSELADALKTAKALDIPAWSQTTWLAELSARCLKEEGEPPTKVQVRDLIDGTRWLLTNVF